MSDIQNSKYGAGLDEICRFHKFLETTGLEDTFTRNGKKMSTSEILNEIKQNFSGLSHEDIEKNSTGQTSLQDVEYLNELLKSGEFDVNEININGETALMSAVSSNHVCVVELLLRHGANPNLRGKKEDLTPLMEASIAGFTDVTRLLLQYGASVIHVSSNDNTALHFAAIAGNLDIVKLLLEYGTPTEVQNDTCHTPLMEATSNGHIDVARCLIEHGANINSHSNEFKESALTLASYKGHAEMVKFLLEAGADHEHRTDEMHTALMEAAMEGHVEVAKLLLNHGANVSIPPDSFESPLTLASCGGHTELALLLIGHEADIEEVNDESYTPLMEAAREGHEETVALLIACGADVNTKTEETQETALTLAACGGFIDVCDLLLSAGADLEVGGVECSTPLMEAAQEGHLELIKRLLQYGACINAQTANGDTAIHFAAEHGNLKVCEELLKWGASCLDTVTEVGKTPLMKAARNGHLQIVQLLVNYGVSIDQTTYNNDANALSLACNGGHAAVVYYLLKCGADPHIQLKDGSTIIIEAVKSGNPIVLSLVLDYPLSLKMNQEELQKILGVANSNSVLSSVSGQQQQQPPPKIAPNSDNLNNQPKETDLENDDPQTDSKDPTNKDGLCLELPIGNENETLSEEEADDDDDEDHETDSAKDQLNVALVNAFAAGWISARFAHEQNKSLLHKSFLSNYPILQNSISSEGELLTTDAIGKKLGIFNDQSSDEIADLIHLFGDFVSNADEEEILKKFESDCLCQMISPDFTSSSITNLNNTDRPSQMKLESTTSSSKMLSSLHSVSESCLSCSDHQQQQQQQIQPTQPPPPPGPPSLPTTQQCKAVDKKSENSSTSSNTASNSSLFSEITVASEGGDGSSRLIMPTNNNNSLDATYPSVKAKSTSNPSTMENQQKQQASPPDLMTSGFNQNDINSVSKINSNLEYVDGLAKEIFDLALKAKVSKNSFLSFCKKLQDENYLREHVLSSPSSPVKDLADLVGNSSSLEDSINQRVTGSASSLCNNSTTCSVKSCYTPLCVHLPVNSKNKSCNLKPGQSETKNRQCQCFSAYKDMLNNKDFLGPNMLSSGSNVKIKSEHLENFMKGFEFARQQMYNTNNPNAPMANPLCPDQAKASVNQCDLKNDLKTESELAINSPSHLQQQQTSSKGACDEKMDRRIRSPVHILDVNAYIDSSQESPLTLACNGGYKELVQLLIDHGADMEHRDKKSYTPLHTAVYSNQWVVVCLLLDYGANIEAQVERTKDTALSIACSHGKLEIVEELLKRGANKEHRNMSDYTPLSLASSSGFIEIIQLLLQYGADINSRTGSKLGISPLMLASMNGHTSAVKLLLENGADINAHIETNKNTALTLACFQGRHEVVRLLVDNKANIEHRAKTGLTPLMEAASGDFVEVGKILISHGADVNALPVLSSRDTALTIAADKGNAKFVNLLLDNGAIVEAKNKKGATPLWLACNSGHMEVVHLLISCHADVNCEDNRGVSCLVAAFRKGHVNVVRLLVEFVTQFPSDKDCLKHIKTIVGENDLVKRCQQCREIIANAKEKQENQARRNAYTLLEQIEAEEEMKASKKASQAKKREKKKMMKKNKKAKEKDKPDDDCRKVNEIMQALSKPEPESNDEQSFKENINKQTSEKKEKKNKNKSAEKESIEKLVGESTNQKSTAQSTKKEIPTTIATKKISKTLEAKSIKPINTNSKSNTNEEAKSSLSDVTKILKEIQIDEDVLDPNYDIGIASDENEEPDWNAFIKMHSEKFLSTTESDKGENWKVVTKKNPNVNNATTGSVPSTTTNPVVANSTDEWKVIPSIVPLNSTTVKETKEVASHVSSRKKIQMNVSRHDIGKVIGQGGSVVSALRTMSGAQIDIESAKGDDIGERMVCLKGQSDLIVNLQEIIIALIQGTITGNDILARFVIHKKSAKAGPIPNFSLSSLVIKNIPKQQPVAQATSVTSKKSPGAFIKPLTPVVAPISKPSPILAPVANVNFATVAAVNPPKVKQVNTKVNTAVSLEQFKKKSLTNSSNRSLPKLSSDKMTPLKLDISNIFHNPEDATLRGEENFDNSNSASYSMKNSRKYENSSGASNHDTNSTAPFGLSSPFPSTNNTANSNVANFSTISKSPIPCASDDIPGESNQHMSPVTPSNSSKSFARAPGSERSMKNHNIQMTNSTLPNQKLPIGNALASASNMLMSNKIFASNTNLFSIDDQQNETPFLISKDSVTPNKRNQNMNDLDDNWPGQNSLLSNGFDHFANASNGLDSLLSNQQKLLGNADNVDLNTNLLTDSYLTGLSQPQTSSMNSISARSNGEFVSFPPGITSTCSAGNRVMRPTSFINNNNNNPLRNGNDIHPNVGAGGPLAQYRVPAFGACPPPPPPNGPAGNSSLHHLQIVNTQLPPPNLMQQSIPPHPGFGQSATPHSLFSKQHSLLSHSSSIQRVLPSYSGMNSPNGLFPNMAEYANPQGSMLPLQTNGGLPRQVSHIQSNNSMPPILTGNSSIVAPIGSERRRNLQNM